MTFFQPTLPQTILSICDELPPSRTVSEPTVSCLVPHMIKAMGAPAAMKTAFRKAQSAEALTLLCYGFVRELMDNEHSLLVLIKEISYARYHKYPRESTGEILCMTRDQKVGLLWWLILGQEQDRLYEILSNAAVATGDCGLAKDLLANHVAFLSKDAQQKLVALRHGLC